ncbi:hypothetical protein ACFQVA_19200 [Actinomadura keratinilytica]
MGKRGEHAEKETAVGRPEGPGEEAGRTRAGDPRHLQGRPAHGGRSRTLMRLLPVVLIVAGVIFDEAAPPASTPVRSTPRRR